MESMEATVMSEAIEREIESTRPRENPALPVPAIRRAYAACPPPARLRATLHHRPAHRPPAPPGLLPPGRPPRLAPSAAPAPRLDPGQTAPATGVHPHPTRARSHPVWLSLRVGRGPLRLLPGARLDSSRRRRRGRSKQGGPGTQRANRRPRPGGCHHQAARTLRNLPH